MKAKALGLLPAAYALSQQVNRLKEPVAIRFDVRQNNSDAASADAASATASFKTLIEQSKGYNDFLKAVTSSFIAHADAEHINPVKNSTASLKKLIEQSKIFCASPLLQEILGINALTETTDPHDFFMQILSRELGATIKQASMHFDDAKKEKITNDIFSDINKAVTADPVQPTPFQVAVTFNGIKALMAYRVAHELWKEGKHEEALMLSNNTKSNYHVDIHPSAQIEAGVFIDHAFGVKIGKNTKIASGAYILHQSKISDNVTIGENAFIGAGAKIAKNITIGDGVTIAAGSYVDANVRSEKTVFGFYSEAGPHKFVLSPRFLNVPQDIKDYHQSLLNSEPKNLSDDEHLLLLNRLKTLTRLNPNSSLTIENLEKFYEKSKPHITSAELTNGNLALIASRIAIKVWQESLSQENPEQKTGLQNFALWLQGRNATLFNVDIHPAATLGDNIKFPDEIKDGIVIGATAKIGNNVYIGDGVTLGGNGKETGDRHPKIGDNCYIGNHSHILGAGQLGNKSIVMPNSVFTLPKGSKTAESEVFSGRPAIRITPYCEDKPECGAILTYLKEAAERAKNGTIGEL